MTYEKQTWENEPSKATPLSAERLNHMEDGVAGAHAVLDGRLSEAGLSATIVQKIEDSVVSASDGYTLPVAPRHRMNSSTMSKFRAAIQRTLAGEADTKILCIGDSTTGGFGGGTEGTFIQDGSYPRFLADLINDHFAPASYGMAVPPGNSAGSPGDSRWTRGTGWEWRLTAAAGADQYLGFGGKGAFVRGSLASTGGSPLKFADPRIVADTFDVYVMVTNGASTANYSIVATGGTPVTGSTANASRGFRRVTVTAGSVSAANEVTVTVTGGTGSLMIAGVEPSNSTSRVIRVSNAGLSGSDSVGWTTDPYSTTDWGSVGMIKAYQPDLTIIDLGINDAGQVPPTATATYLANVGKLAAAARISGDVVFKTFVPTNGRQVKQAEYAAALITSVEVVYDLFNHYESWEKTNALGWMSDTLHPNAIGYRAIARAVGRGLFPGSIT